MLYKTNDFTGWALAPKSHAIGDLSVFFLNLPMLLVD
jgi:hypothetical protein